MGARIIFPTRGEVRFETFVPRLPERGEVLVKTLYSLMSIGTETTILHGRYAADSHFAARFSFPQMKTGVQAVGIVRHAGDGVTGLRAGERIFMRMAHVSHWTLAAEQCSPVPEDLDPKAACWCGLAKTAFRAAHAAPFSLGGNALVVGAGPVGQMTVRWAKAAGVDTIAVVDLAPVRLGFAARGGATHCFEGTLEAVRTQLLADCAREGFDIVVDTTGNPAVFSAALGFVAVYGKLVLLGDTGYPGRQCLTSDVMTRGLTIIATHDHHDRGGWTQPRIDRLFFRLVQSRIFRLDGLITHEFAPEACEEAYRLATDHRESTLGVLFDWTRRSYGAP